MANKFKAGDKVICVSDKWSCITKGGEYEVRKDDEGGITYIYDNCGDFGDYPSSTFMLAGQKDGRDFLKAFRRAKTKNGKEGLLAQQEDGNWVIKYTLGSIGWDYVDFDRPEADHFITEIYAVPHAYDLLDGNERGALLWKSENPVKEAAEAAVAKAKAELDAAEAALAALT